MRFLYILLLMPLFVCDECKCIENTSGAWYWYRKHPDPKYSDRYLCTECAPTHYGDGTATGLGKWKRHFEKKKATKEYIKRNRQHFVYTSDILPKEELD